MKKTVALVAGLAVVASLAWTFWPRSAPPAPPRINDGYLVEATPNEIMKYIDGLNSPLVLVNFWASWCEPCKEEFPSILALRKSLAKSGLKVVLISIDEAQDQQAAEDFLHAQKVGFQTFFKGHQPISFVSDIYPAWEGSVPTTLLIGHGKILDAWEGDASLSEFKERVLKQLKGS